MTEDYPCVVFVFYSRCTRQPEVAWLPLNIAQFMMTQAIFVGFGRKPIFSLMIDIFIMISNFQLASQ